MEYYINVELDSEKYQYVKENHFKTIPIFFNDWYLEIIISERHYKELLEFENDFKDYKELLDIIKRDLLN